ncbi:MAG: RHS repeat-associated core domain-containing protein, partial [Petrimonas sp.]|nr:RHS repeat-associated core domain-containing protein [Petrimonas sp.]
RTTLRYDALGRRTSKETNGRKTVFYWDGDRLLSDTRHRESPRDFVYYPGTFVPFAAIEESGKIRYYSNDIAGLPQEVRDEEGNVLWQARYDALGRVASLKGNYRFDNPIRLQGQYYDEELELCYNRYRYFDPQICSYISEDPLGLAAGENLYSYAPNVWGWVDPLGLCKGILGPDGPGQFVMNAGGPLEKATVVRHGEFVNRVFDSRYGIEQNVSGPLGRSFYPGSGVPTTTAEAIQQRGLGIYYNNNAQQAIIYRATKNIPATSRTAIGGSGPEIIIGPDNWPSLEPIIQYPVFPN